MPPNSPRFLARTVTLHDQCPVVLRAGTPDNAQAFFEHSQLVQSTAEFIVTLPHEARPPAEVRTQLQALADRPGGLALFACPAAEPDRIVGDCVLTPWKEDKLAHVADLGMGCHAEWRSLGLGTALLRAAIEHARAHPALRRIELGAYAENHAALRLYDKLGFVRDGILAQRFQKSPGVFSDEVIMSLNVGPTD